MYAPTDQYSVIYRRGVHYDRLLRSYGAVEDIGGFCTVQSVIVA
jgi:hypothetical protein